ncbi:hypothetical protein I6F26_30640 [Ensifer sp. IC3342]|nr:hypothetical protein [Ensifer sp. BRP08]MCA1450865.1 hypothetical protein [Ensifer sp. IC3342]
MTSSWVTGPDRTPAGGFPWERHHSLRGGGLPYWAAPAADLMAEYDIRPTGLSSRDAQERMARYGPNSVARGDRFLALSVLIRQFRSPLVLILVFAAAMSVRVGERNDAIIIILIVLASCVLSFVQEYRASRAGNRDDRAHAVLFLGGAGQAGSCHS